MQALQPWFNAISDFEDHRSVINGLRIISTNPQIPEVARILTQHGKYYPMFHGADGREAVFTNWCVSSLILYLKLCSTNIPVLYRYDLKPYFLGWSTTRTKKCGTLLEAFEWLLMRGTEYYSADEEAARVEACAQVLANLNVTNASSNRRPGIRDAPTQVERQPSNARDKITAMNETATTSVSLPATETTTETTATTATATTDPAVAPTATVHVHLNSGQDAELGTSCTVTADPQATPTRVHPRCVASPAPTTPRHRKAFVPDSDPIEVSSGEESVPPLIFKSPVPKAKSRHTSKPSMLYTLTTNI